MSYVTHLTGWQRLQGPRGPWVSPQGQVQNHGLITLITLQGITTAHVIVLQTQTRTTEWRLFLSLATQCSSYTHYMLAIWSGTSGICMANLMWQLIYILWQDTSNRRHWLQALGSTFFIPRQLKRLLQPCTSHRRCPFCLLSASRLKREMDVLQIAVPISHGEPPDIP